MTSGVHLACFLGEGSSGICVLLLKNIQVNQLSVFDNTA